MVEVKEILRLWLDGRSLREVTTLAGVDRKTVRRYVQAAQAAGLVRDGGPGQLSAITTAHDHRSGPMLMADRWSHDAGKRQASAPATAPAPPPRLPWPPTAPLSPELRAAWLADRDGPAETNNHCNDPDWWNAQQSGDPSDYVSACGEWPCGRGRIRTRAGLTGLCAPGCSMVAVAVDVSEHQLTQPAPVVLPCPRPRL